MAKLTQAQIAQVAARAGMSDPITMSAIAMAESGGRTDAHNPIPPDDSYGLWQINMIGSNGPARRRELGISSNTALYNPAVNARAAAKILSTQGLSAWSTYTTKDPTKSYKRFLPKTDAKGQAVQAGWWGDFWDGFKKGFDVGPGPEDLADGGTGNDPSLGDVGGVNDLAKGIGTMAEAVQKTAVWLGNARNWIRIGYVVGGGVLVALGLTVVAKPLINQTPAGRIVKQVKQAGTKAPAKSGGKGE